MCNGESRLSASRRMTRLGEGEQATAKAGQQTACVPTLSGETAKDGAPELLWLVEEERFALCANAQSCDEAA
jgi:hypothetical protein